MSDIRKIGFIGLGNMGGPMAANLVNAGYEVHAFDLDADRCAAVAGAQACSSAREAASRVDLLISMLPAGRHVRELYVGGILQDVDDTTLIVDCSTIDPVSAQTVAAAAKNLGIGFLDAPVSGGTGGAQAGTLTFIVGGEAADLDRARPVLERMGANIFHAGGAGAGQIAKICNNMLLAVQMIGTAEALAMGVDNGLDPKVLSEIMKASSGGNWALNVYNPYPGVMEGVPAAREFSGGFLVNLMNKDLALAMQTAEGSASSVPMGALAQNLYRVHTSTNEAGTLDFSSIQYLYKPGLKKK